ncbi:MAG: thymidine kinase [Chloroflexota bacterium]
MAEKPGSAGLEVITGCMFSGKTEEVLRRVRRALIARQSVAIFSHSLDDRYAATAITSHDSRSFSAQSVASTAALAELLLPDTDLLVIDEAQFFDEALGPFCNALASRGQRVVAAGLDLDFRGEPFGPIPALLALADSVEKLTAVCAVCGEPATRTQRLVGGRPASYSDPTILVGAASVYEARCRRHHVVPDHPPLDLPLQRGSQLDLLRP